MNRIKRITAFILLALMAVPHVGLHTVLASVQPGVPDLDIEWQSGTGASPTFRITWDQITNHVYDTTDFAVDDNTGLPAQFNNLLYKDYGAQSYAVQYKDVTRNAGGAWTSVANPPTPGTQTTYTFNNFTARNGTLYSFRVVPSHYHPVYTNNNVSSVTTVTPAANQISEVLFVSDISVESSGKNGELTVTWDDPRYGNNSVFTSYKITYARVVGSTSTTFSRTVSEAQWTRIPADETNGPRLSYTISDPTGIYTGNYYVRVEPLDASGREIRSLAGDPTVTIGATSYRVAFTTALYDTNASVQLTVSLEEVGRDLVNLTWGNLTGLGDVTEIAIYSASTEAELLNYLASYKQYGTARDIPTVTLRQNNAQYSQYYRIPESTEMPLFYAIGYTYNGLRDVSNIVRYVPTAYDIVPNTPDIHTPIDGNDTQVIIWWDAFLRESYFAGDTIADCEIGPVTITYDNAVSYDLYVVDDMNTFTLSGVKPEAINSLSLPDAEGHEKTPGGAEVPAYNYTVTTYIDSNGTRRPFEKNKLYYVKLIARKSENTESAPAYATFYIPLEGEISSPPMLQKPPLEIRRDENSGSEKVTQTTIDVTWLEKWSEVYDYSRDLSLYAPTAPGNEPEWQTRAAIEGDNIYYGDDAKEHEDSKVEFHSELDLDKVRDMLKITGSVPTVPARTLSIEGSLYEAKYLLYDDFNTAVKAAGSFNAYLEELMTEPLRSNGWTGYTPSRLDENNNPVNPYITVQGLQANTTYAILVRPYRIVSGQTMLGYANFIAASTVPIPGVLDVTPTPPVVDAVTWTDTSATIRWKNAATIDYEVVYSSVYYNDIEAQFQNGVSINFATVMNNSVVKKDAQTGEEFRYLDIEGLFPDTEYFFWVRARSQTNRVSFWSNSAYIKTEPLRVPNPPNAFGLASASDLSLINEQGGTDFTPKNKNYLVMEWRKDEYDPVTTGTGTNTAVADILTEPSLEDVYIAKFNNLISNKVYYFRAKTLLTVTMDANRNSQEEYSYLIQISLEPDFVEKSEIYVPKEPTVTLPYRQTESAWTPTIYYRTNTSGDDYDTDFDPDLVPLPDEDFEISFDGMTQTLTYRFRSSGKDAKGNYDNRVDQRLITTLVNRKAHNYNIDVTKYESYNIKRRVVEVPYALIKAFEERKINLGIRAGDVTLSLPPGTMDTAQVKNTPGYGDNASLQVIFNEGPAGMPALGAKDSYAMTPQDVELYLSTPNQYVKMVNTGVPLDVRLSVDNRYDLLDKNLGAYVSNEQTAGWSFAKSTYDKENGQMELKSQPGMYSVISKAAPDTISFDQSTTPMLNVSSSITPTDMTVFNGNAPATSNQMLNLMDAIVKGKREVAMNAQPDASAYTALQKAGINIGPNAPTVLREQAIAGMLRLYEIKTKQQIKSSYTLADTPYSDTRNAHQTYQPAMLKAAEIDMLNGKTALRPKENITLGELFELADVIISDAGM